MEYCSPIWQHLYLKDSDRLEKVQQRATRLIPEIRNEPYAQRLRLLNLPTLEFRRIRTALIQVFKISTGIDKLHFLSFFTLADYSRTRGHKLKMVKSRSNLRVRHSFLTQSICDIWNALPPYVVESKTINQFKNGLEKCMSDPRLKFAPYDIFKNIKLRDTQATAS